MQNSLRVAQCQTRTGGQSDRDPGIQGIAGGGEKDRTRVYCRELQPVLAWFLGSATVRKSRAMLKMGTRR